MAAWSFFSDSGCTQPLGWEQTKGCTPPAYAYQAYQQAGPSGSCGSTGYRIVPVGSAYTGAVYQGTPSACTARSSDGGPDDIRSTYDFYMIGSEIPPSTYVAATVQTDP
jgi:hypothetical protein